MNHPLRKFFISILLLLAEISAWSLEIKSISVTDEIRWSIETTSGWQNIRNVMSKEDGISTQVQQSLHFKGILFHSFLNGTPALRSQLNLGFDKRTRFLWTDSPDFNHNEEKLNEHLRCTHFDIQGMYPVRVFYRLWVSPFAGYSFINYSYDENFSGITDTTMAYNSVVLGMGIHHKISRSILHNYFFSYSPIVFENDSKSTIQFINYGFEIIANTHPISITLFLTSKKAFMQRGKLIFEGTDFKFTTLEAGFSMHLNLR